MRHNNNKTRGNKERIPLLVCIPYILNIRPDNTATAESALKTNHVSIYLPHSQDSQLGHDEKIRTLIKTKTKKRLRNKKG